MSHARWRPSASAASIRLPSEEARAARDQTLADRLRQRPSLLSADADPARDPPDDGEARSGSPRRSARRHSSSTGVVAATDLTSWQPSRKSSRQSCGAPRSADRRRSRFSDVRELEDRVATSHCEADNASTEPPVQPSQLTHARYLAATEPSQSGLSDSVGSSQAVSGSLPTTPRDPPNRADRMPMTRQEDRSPVRNPAREFQVKRGETEKLSRTGQQGIEKEEEGVMNSRAVTSSIPPIVRKTLLDFDRIQKLKTAAERAMRDRRVFMIHGGYPSIRLALKRRGWVEKKYLINRNESEDDIDVSRWPLDNNDSVTIGLAEVLSLKGSKNSMIMTRLLREHQPNLIWSAKREVIDFINLDRDQLVNHFPRAPFNTKIGLCSLAQGMHWFNESLPAAEFIPRAYRIGMAEEKQEFVDDFRLTACVSLLVWFRERFELHGAAGVEDVEGEVPYSVIPTALQQCQAYIANCQHEDIEPSAFNRALWPHQWDNFMTNVYKVLHKKKKLEMHHDENSTIVKVFYNRIVQLLDGIEQYRPQTRLDGCLNIWIVKPGSASRGRGIILLRQLDDILALVDSATQREGKWVVQKYCERPLLIYNTKFDIRQWFLVTDWNPLTVWMYKQSYLRFSSQQFNLDDLKEAIHLCNNAVQQRYRNGERHAALPTENMWDSSTFQQFLKTREAGHAWDQIIYPGMKRAFISVCLATQTELEPRKGCFELYGVDFLLTEDYQPWLIEVNSSPAMGASTSVTAWLCAMCLEDTIRVIVDRRKDPAADVGEFECIVQQPAVTSPRYLGIDLALHGHRIKPPPNPPPASPPLAELPAPPPAQPRVPAAQSSPAVREANSRLTAIPSSQSTPAASTAHQRSRSQAPPTANTAAGGGGGKGTAQPGERSRRRSQSQAAPGALAQARVSSVSTTFTPPTKPPQPPSGQKQRQKAAKKPAALRRRSRTQVIQSSVRRLSAPRRSRSAIKQKMAAVAAAAPPAQTSVPRPAASVPRNPLEVAARRPQPAGPRAQQLVTAGEQLPQPTAAELARAPASETRVATPTRPRPRSVTRSADNIQRHASVSETPVNPPPTLQSQPRPSADAVGQAGSHFVTSSLDKLERIRLASEEAVRRINSLTVAPPVSRASAIAAAAAGQKRANQSSTELVENKAETGRVKWVAMHPFKPVYISSSKPPATGQGSLAGTGTAASSPPGSPRAWTVSPAVSGIPPAARGVLPAPRVRSPVTAAGSPPVAPRTISLTSRADPSAVPTPRPAAGVGTAGTPRQSGVGVLGRGLVPAVSWGSPVAASQAATPEEAVSASDSWHTTLSEPPESAPRPATVGARGQLLPLLPTSPRRDAARTAGVSPTRATAAGVSPTRAPAAAAGTPSLRAVPRSQQQQQAFNTRITELKGLIDRAIEETREFLGRSRSQPRPDGAAVPVRPLTDFLQPQRSPRPLLTPTIVDIAVRRASVSPRDAVWDRRSEPDEAPRTGSARYSPRRPSQYQWRTPPTPGSPAAPQASSRTETRLTELVGLQGRRFLPTLDAPEPLPRRQR